MFFFTIWLFAGLLLTEEIFHRYPRFALAFFSIATVILSSCWILLVGNIDWFPWVKVLSIASGIFMLSLLRVTRLGGNATIIQLIVYAFLVVNILEATMRDAVTGDTANYLNVVTGFLLVATLEKLRTIHIDKIGRYMDLYWSGMTLPWIIGYTLWNWMFIYLNFGFQSSLQHIAVLASALIIGFTNKDRWLQARVFTLGMYFILFHSFPHLNSVPSTDMPNERLGLFLSLIPFAYMVVYAIFYLRRVKL